MPVYNPPLDDIRFVLNEVLKAGALSKTIADYAEADWETVSGLLDAVGDYARDIAFPLNQRAQDLMMGAPSEVSARQLRDVHIRLAEPPKADKPAN